MTVGSCGVRRRTAQGPLVFCYQLSYPRCQETPLRWRKTRLRLDRGRLTARLQSVLHAAARQMYSKWDYEHITPLVMELHWLSVPERIQFKLAVLVFRCLRGTAPPYLADQLQRWEPWSHAEGYDPRPRPD